VRMCVCVRMCAGGAHQQGACGRRGRGGGGTAGPLAQAGRGPTKGAARVDRAAAEGRALERGAALRAAVGGDGCVRQGCMGAEARRPRVKMRPVGWGRHGLRAGEGLRQQ